MSTITARSVRRSITKAGNNPAMPDGLPGKKRGTGHSSSFTKRHTTARLGTGGDQHGFAGSTYSAAARDAALSGQLAKILEAAQ